MTTLTVLLHLQAWLDSLAALHHAHVCTQTGPWGFWTWLQTRGFYAGFGTASHHIFMITESR